MSDKKIEDMTEEELGRLDEGHDEHPAEVPAMVASEDGVISEPEADKHWDKDA